MVGQAKGALNYYGKLMAEGGDSQARGPTRWLFSREGEFNIQVRLAKKVGSFTTIQRSQSTRVDAWPCE